MPLNPNQARCATTFGRPIAVMAGAGSGKTFTLKERIANAIQGDPASGVEPVVSGIDKVLAITFTEKAALELKSRIKQALRQRGRQDQAMLVDDAWISTIHGMCSRILRENALALGIDPAFKILSEPERDARLDAASEQVLCNDKTVEKDAASLFGEYPRDVLKEMISTLVSCAVKSPDEFGSILGATFPTPVETDLSLADHNELFAQRLAEAHKLWPALFRVARSSYERFCEKKLEDGVFDNNDLLIRAAHALRNPGIRARYANRFGLVMIDEFQDTDSMQLEIIRALAGENGERLCVVGDPQQSIYRFRGADLSVCAGHLASISAGPDGDDAVIRLAENYRSHAAVLDFVDVAFGPEGAVPDPSDPYPAPTYYQRLIPSRDESRVREAKRLHEGEGPRVVVQEVQFRYGSSRVARDGTAALVARRFHDVHEATGRSWGDMVILLGSMTHANDYARALDAEGIPWAITGGSVFRSKSDALLMIDLARVLANPDDTEALYALLTSDVFGLTPADVLAAGVAVGPRRVELPDGRSFDAPCDFARAFATLLVEGSSTVTGASPLQASVEVGTRVEVALRVLRRALARVAQEPVAKVMEGVLVESGWLERMQADHSTRGGTVDSQETQSVGGRSRVANALKAIRMVRDLELDGCLGARSVAEGLAVAVNGAKEAPGVLSSRDNDFVRIMTIHASKGLQFPIVAASELGGGGFPNRSPLTCESMGGQTYVVLDLKNSVEDGSDLASCKKGALEEAERQLKEDHGINRATDAGFAEMLRVSDEQMSLPLRLAAMRLHCKEQDAEELERKLYVAFTRAEEALIVCMTGSVTTGDIDKAITDIPGDPHDMAGIAKTIRSKAKAVTAADKELAKQDRTDLRDHVNLTSLAPKFEGVLARIRDRREEVEGRGGEYRLVTCQDLGLWEATGALPHAWDPTTPEHAHGEYVAFASADDAPVDEAEDEGTPLPIPRDLPDQPDTTHRLSPTWADAMLSASALHAAEADAQGLSNLGYRGSFEDVDVDDIPAPATEKGTAFHTLGEIAALRWRPGQALVAPTDRIEAVCKVHGLNAAQVEDVRVEVGRWIASPVAVEMASHAHLLPEPPFYVGVSAGDGEIPITLDGFIDLLAFDELGRGVAHVVDYKTGRFLDTDEKRRASYEVQAKCYAYALMLQGFEEVRLSFVFVDQPDDAGNPQVCAFPAPGEPPYALDDLRAYLSERVATLK